MNTRLSSVLALALVLAGGAIAGSARADDAFGAYMQNQPIAAARSYFDHSTAIAQPQPGTTSPRVVSTVPTVDGRTDIVGNHGPQDALANEIYRPGSRPIGW
jgi:hypothetical protein